MQDKRGPQGSQPKCAAGRGFKGSQSKAHPLKETQAQINQLEEEKNNLIRSGSQQRQPMLQPGAPGTEATAVAKSDVSSAQKRNYNAITLGIKVYYVSVYCSPQWKARGNESTHTCSMDYSGRLCVTAVRHRSSSV